MRSEINAVSGFRILLLRFWEFLESPPHTELTLGPISLHSMIWLPYFCNHTPLLTLSNLWKFFLHLGGSRICRIRIRGFMTLCGVCVEFMTLCGVSNRTNFAELLRVNSDDFGWWVSPHWWTGRMDPNSTNLHQSALQQSDSSAKSQRFKKLVLLLETLEEYALKKFRFSQEWSWPHWSSTSVSSPCPQCK